MSHNPPPPKTPNSQNSTPPNITPNHKNLTPPPKTPNSQNSTPPNITPNHKNLTPPPRTTNLPPNPHSSVIINGGHYKVTEVRPPCSPPSHVYSKHPSHPEAKHPSHPEEQNSPNHQNNPLNHNREPTPQESTQRFLVSPQITRRVAPKVSADPYVNGLNATGLLSMSGMNVVWPTSSDNCYPGAPSKHVLKNALLGLSNGISITYPTSGKYHNGGISSTQQAPKLIESPEIKGEETKVPGSGPAGSPESDVSSLSDFSCGSNKVVDVRKVKKAWLQRHSDESDDSAKVAIKRKNDDNELPLKATTPPHAKVAEDGLCPPSKKPKKKNKKKEKSDDFGKKKKKFLTKSKKYLLQIEEESVCDVIMGDNEDGLPESLLTSNVERDRLKTSGEAFIQDAACHELSSYEEVTLCNSLPPPRCRECKGGKKKENSAVFCRFYGFRKLAFVDEQLQSAGFCNPEDSKPSDLRLWLPANPGPTSPTEGSTPHNKLSLQSCEYILSRIGVRFCELVESEKEAMKLAESSVKPHWKRPISGVREMCDACETTLFNIHWVCHHCGFGVCTDCYKSRQSMSREEMEECDVDKRNPTRWLKCTRGKSHDTMSLIPTQIIPSSCLFDLHELSHQASSKLGLPVDGSCSVGGVRKPTLNTLLINKQLGDPKMEVHHPPTPPLPNMDKERFKMFNQDNLSPLDVLASVAAVRGVAGCNTSAGKVENTTESLCERSPAPQPPPTNKWLCNRQLLQLTDGSDHVNVESFQTQWGYGLPVVASGAEKKLTPELWKPSNISDEHGEEPTGNALVNCRLGSIITNAHIKDFWNGFECIANRMTDDKTGERMILKLKDWPTTDDFLDTMPHRFKDLMSALPLPEYTARDGQYNIAGYLPDFFVRPDLGPKMYIAYGWVTEKDWNQGTTNLHLDISDACNLMVYVGVPMDQPPGSLNTMLEIIKEGDVDEFQLERSKTSKPGALWHIFKASDTDKIRQLILKVKAEEGVEVPHDHDPIHDQQIYLDKTLRKRLKDEYGVSGYAIVQCEGDSVFIPAGAPHQVFNLHSCIKVAEDFVSPDHVDKCFKLTEEFRRLSSSHSNHEDKLQLKNIVYHAIKEVLTSIAWHEANNCQ
nr:lysine-specific demethylase 3B [Ciona intestinalis]|eukprot:XP_002122286.3 lysine-specific demethylase 3B [Ciona intestinalis]